MISWANDAQFPFHSDTQRVSLLPPAPTPHTLPGTVGHSARQSVGPSARTCGVLRAVLEFGVTVPNSNVDQTQGYS